MDSRMPCGCRLDRDEDNKLRMFYCAPHAFAYEMLEALQEAARALDHVVLTAPPDWDATQAIEAGLKSRRVLKKAKGAQWGA